MFEVLEQVYYIRPDVAKQILDAQLEKIINNLIADKQIRISISENVYSKLLENALNNLDNGGRGIGNIVENLFINPLSRWLFDNEIFDNSDIAITAINTKEKTNHTARTE